MADLPIVSDNAGAPVIINDPSTAANIANVKAGSTAAVAGDNALVVTFSPNTPLPTGSNTIGAVTGTKTNNNAAPGATNVGVLPALANAASPSWTEGDQVLESVDLSGRQRFRGTLTTNNAAPSSDGQMALTVVANANPPSYTEGNLVLASVDLAGSTRVVGTKTNNSAAPTTQVGVMPALANAAAPTWVEGNQTLLSVDLTGAQRVQQKIKNTYSASASWVVVAGATDVFTIAGSATKKVTVLRILINGTKTTAGQELLVLIKRSSVNTGGTFTSTAGFIVPHDSTSPASTAVSGIYTANPTALGTVVGNARTARAFFPALLTATADSLVVWEFITPPDPGIVLRGTSEILALNLQSGSTTGDNIYLSIDWTEE